MDKELDELDYDKIIDRMIEEAGVDNARRLCEEIGAGLSYAYQLKDRGGLTGGFLDKYLRKYPDADYNYVFRGKRYKLSEDAKEAIRTLASYLSESENDD